MAWQAGNPQLVTTRLVMLQVLLMVSRLLLQPPPHSPVVKPKSGCSVRRSIAGYGLDRAWDNV